MKRKICVVFIVLLLICSLSYSIANATTGESIRSSFGGETTEDGGTVDVAASIIGAVLTIVRISGVTTAVVILMVIGAKYIIASAGDRADIKKYAVRYVIGALILFSASGLIGLIQNFTEQSMQN